MPAGIIVYNDSGTIQIDENYQNLFVLASGTGTPPSLSGYSPSVMFARGAGGKWYVIDTLPASTPDPGYGFRVWTADGKLVFDATKKPARFAGNYGPITDPNATISLPSGRVYAVVTRAALYNQKLTVMNDGAPPNIWRHTRENYTLTPVISGNTLSFAWTFRNGYDDFLPYNEKPKGVYDDNYGAAAGYIFDMTNY